MATLLREFRFAAGGVRAGVGLSIMFGIIYTGADLISYGCSPFPAISLLGIALLG